MLQGCPSTSLTFGMQICLSAGMGTFSSFFGDPSSDEEMAGPGGAYNRPQQEVVELPIPLEQLYTGG